jgi:hypothetical protein
MTVREHVCLDDDRFADGTFDRKSAAIDLGLHVLDDRP